MARAKPATTDENNAALCIVCSDFGTVGINLGAVQVGGNYISSESAILSSTFSCQDKETR